MIRHSFRVKSLAKRLFFPCEKKFIETAAQEGEEHFQYHGKPVDSLDKGCHDHRNRSKRSENKKAEFKI